MNLSPRWVAVLREAGIEAVHWAVLGPAYTSDLEIMKAAKRLDHVIFTQDLDFGVLLATSNSLKPSVLQLRTEELDPDLLGPQVIRVLQQFQIELETGAFITFDPRRTRVRILPLGILSAAINMPKDLG